MNPTEPRHRPPAGWRALLRLVLPGEDRGMLLEETDLLYSGRHASKGERAARRWYRRQVLHFALRWPIELGRTVLVGLRTEFGSLARVGRRSARSLIRTPGFTGVSTMTLALGIGATAVIVGIADRALLRALPFPESEELVAALEGWGTSLGSIEVLQRTMTTVVALGGAQNAVGMTLEYPDAPAERITVASVSPEYLMALGTTPVLGRSFTAAESRPGEGQVLLLGHPFWTAHYGADPGAVGQSLVLDGQSYTIIGVLPPGFDMPTRRNDVWRPAVADPANPGQVWGAGNFTVVARMAPGATPDDVRRELVQVQEQVRLANPLWTPNPDFWDNARVSPLREARARGVRAPLLILLSAVGMLLLVVCANVTSLLVSRGLARSRDHAVRAALGADRWRLAHEQLVEVLVLSGLGLAAGIGVALAGLSLLRPFLPSELPGVEAVGLDVRVLGITTAIALLTAVGAGLIPALRAARAAPAQVLKESGRAQGMSAGRRRTTRWLVSAQLAAAVVLVTAAGLVARTLLQLGQVDPGFDPQNRVSAQVHLPPGLPEDAQARASLFAGLGARLEAEPALQRVAVASTIPFGAESEYIAVAIDGVTQDPNDLPVMAHHRVSANYFEVAGIPLRRGRAFGPQDRSDGTPVAVVDEVFVDRYLQGRDPIGQVIRYPWRGAPAIHVVGVVGATRHEDLSGEVDPTVWVPLAQMGMGPLGHAVLVGTASGGVDAALGALAAGTRAFDDRIAVSDMATYTALLADSLADTRLLALLLTLFAATTLVLGCIGVYGVAAFSVRERTREIGVRMAIGAPVGQIRRAVLRDGLRLAVPGGVVGILLAIPAVRALDGMLHGVAAFDLWAWAGAPSVLAVAALLAVYLPARRATLVDPATVLRND